MLGNFLTLPQGFGGWTFSVHHAYDPHRRLLYLGNGTRNRSI